MKTRLLSVVLFLLLFTSSKAQLIQGTIKSGPADNEIEVWIMPDFSNTTQYLFQLGFPIAFPASAAVQPTNLTVTLDPSFIASFGNNYSVTVNPIAQNTAGTERYFNVVLIRGGTGASNPQTWDEDTEYKVLTAAFTPINAPGAQVKLADYQDGGSDGQGNFYTQDGSANYYVTSNSPGNFYTSPESTAGGTASAGYAQTIALISLPVKLQSFSGYKNGNKNTLQWTTGSEFNNLGFEILRSTDGQNYDPIGFVSTRAINGNSGSELSYSFDDMNPVAKKQYYKLKQIDFDHRSQLSNIVLITGDKPLGLVIDRLFPNPTTSSVNVIVNTPGHDQVTLVITDLTGRIIKQQIANVEAGSNTIHVELNSLSNGNYQLRLISKEGYVSNTIQLVKQ